MGVMLAASHAPVRGRGEREAVEDGGVGSMLLDVGCCCCWWWARLPVELQVPRAGWVEDYGGSAVGGIRRGAGSRWQSCGAVTVGACWWGQLSAWGQRGGGGLRWRQARDRVALAARAGSWWESFRGSLLVGARRSRGRWGTVATSACWRRRRRRFSL